MKVTNGRLLYEIIFWGIVGTLLYLNRGLYTDVRNFLDPIFQAYTPVAMFLLGLTLFIFVNYLREAIAATVIFATQRVSGDQPLNFEKGNLGSNIQKTARRLERKGDFQAAGEAYESLEMWRDAAMVYERGNVFGRAANAWQQADNPGKAVEFYEKDGNFEMAGELCQREGLQDRASRNFRIAGDLCVEQNQFSAAAEFYEKAQDYNRAGAMYEQAHKPEHALDCYDRDGNTSKILELIKQIHPTDFLRRGEEFTSLIQRGAESLVSTGHLAEAASVFEECHAFTRAAEVYASNKQYEKSAELYLKAEQLPMVEQTIGHIENKSVAADIAARMALKKGEWGNAGRLFEEAGKNGQAIDAYKKARDFEGAANLYEKMGRYIMAGEMYSSSRKFTEAANAYAKAYDWRNAAECFEESGDLAQAIEAYANAGNYLKAGTIALKVTDYARAVEYLQRIPPGAPDFQKATAFLATAFYYQSHYDMAYELFVRVMDDLPLNRDTLPAYYAYASYLEPNDPKSSLGLFRQILGIDVHYSDTVDHVQKLERIVTSMSTGYGGKTPNPSGSKPGISAGSTLKAPPISAPVNQGAAVSIASNSGSFSHQATADTRHHGTSSTSLPANHAPLLDQRYQLQSELGHYGRVADHVGLDTETGEQISIRTFPTPEDQNIHDATVDLLKSAVRLSHDDINPVTTFGETGNMMYTVSPLVNGQNLRQWIRTRGPLSVGETRQLFGRLLHALDYAHSQDVCHLNLRPEIILKSSLEEGKIILTGFGVPVRQPHTMETLHLTMPDFDPQYLAPEQIVGSDVDCRTDIYSAGLLLFFVLTGRTPFEVKRVTDTQEIARMQVQTSLPRPSNIRATLPAIVDEVFLKCVNKSPLSRYQAVSELQGDLQQFQTNAIN